MDDVNNGFSIVSRAEDIMRDKGGVSVTTYSRRLIVSLLDGLAFEPDRRWSAGQTESLRREYFDPRFLAERLLQVAGEENTKSVQTFDVIHWIIKHASAFGPVDKY